MVGWVVRNDTADLTVRELQRGENLLGGPLDLRHSLTGNLAAGSSKSLRSDTKHHFEPSVTSAHTRRKSAAKTPTPSISRLLPCSKRAFFADPPVHLSNFGLKGHHP